MVRPQVLLPVVLVLAVGLGLGLRVMLRQPSAATPDAAGTAPPAAVDRGTGVPQGHVYCGIADEPDSVNPFTAHGSTVRRYVLGFTHEGLLDSDPVTGELRPALASAWEVEPGAPAATFTLRPGARFADGAPVTMADVLFGWELARAGHLQFGFVGDAFGRVAGAEALDEHRLRLLFRARQHGVLRAVAETWLVAQRRFFVDAVAALAQRQGQPVPAVDSPAFAALLRQVDRTCGPGTGPFQLPNDADGPTTWRRRQDLLLPQNPHHWRRAQQPGTWNLAAVRLLFRDRSVAHAELYARNVDWFFAPDCAALLQSRAELQQHYRTLVYDNPAQGVLGMLWNCGRAPLDDARVRRALCHLFDRDAVVRLYSGNALPAQALAKPRSPEYPPDLRQPPFDPGEARRLLREAGHDPAAGRPLRLTVVAATGDPQVSHVLALFADAARKAGVELTARELEFTAFVAQKTRGEWDGLLAIRDLRSSGDPYDYVHSAGADNDGKWRHAEADRLAERARAEFDAGRRAALLHELHRLVLREQPVAPIVHPLVAILFNVHVQNAEPGPRGLWPERFWVAPEWQRR
ncbi:MAG: ABC transporter substrate-binding protein [Planctomycetes bacterium]|nr:ABC transporter substrate-binding protein [Planctomycetota bacterium]